jgi:hypothetical protein
MCVKAKEHIKWLCVECAVVTFFIVLYFLIGMVTYYRCWGG